MWGTCKIVNFSWLLFSTLVIGQNLLTQKKHPFKVDCKCILLRNRPSCRFTHSLCKNENIICGESTVAAYQNKLLSTLPGSLLNCLFPLDVQNEIQLLSGVLCYSWLVCLLGFWLRNTSLVKLGNPISDGIVFVFTLLDSY